jgi:hypothetical protein
LRMASILHKSTGAELQTGVDAHIALGYSLANKKATIQIDALLPIYFNQAIAYPLLVVESAAPSTIWDESRKWNSYYDRGHKKESDYYQEARAAV